MRGENHFLKKQSCRTIIILFTLMLYGSVFGQLMDSAWPMYNRDPQHTGLTPCVGPDAPEVAWTYMVGSWIQSSAAIDDKGNIYFGSANGNLYALSSEGKELWRFKTRLFVQSSPAIGHDGTIYVGSWDSTLYAINPDGSQKWQYRAGSHVGEGPCIAADGAIYISAGDQKLHAVNPDGSQKWTFPIAADLMTAPTLDRNGTIYFGAQDWHLYAINPDGTLKWATQLGDWLPSSPAIDFNGTIYIGCDDDKLYAINPDGTIKWTFQTGGNIPGSPSFDDAGNIYFGSFDTYVYSLKPDGTLRWKLKTDDLIWDSSPTIDAAGTIYIGSHDNAMYAIHPDGSLKWKFSTTDGIDVSAVLDENGRLYFGSKDGTFYALGEQAPSDSISWLAHLNLSDAGQGSGELVIGQDATASDSLDEHLGETELPPLPPGGTFDARLELPVDPAIYSMTDIRHDAEGTAIWTLLFQPSDAGYPMLLEWNPDELPAGNFRLEDELGGIILQVDMKEQSSASIPSGVTCLRIIMEKNMWKANLMVSDAGDESTTLSFGQAKGASDGLDSAFGEIELPPSPPSGVLDARFVLPISPSVESTVDIRSLADQNIQWKFKIQAGAGGYPITLQWDSSALPVALRLKDEVTQGSIINVEMRKQNSYTLTNSAISALIIDMSTESCIDVGCVNGWNLVSTPVDAADMSVTSLFPTAISDAFCFDNGYIAAGQLVTGEGYWLKFADAEAFNLCGNLVTKDIPVTTGWNIIGPFDQVIPTTAITSEPAGIISSEFFGYQNGYQSASELVPGKGYWIKVSQDGVLQLSTESIHKKQATRNSRVDWRKLADLPTLYFQDNNGGCAKLYLSFDNLGSFELPPLPPKGVFDVRFADNSFVAAAETDIVIQANAPVKVRAENFDDLVLSIRDENKLNESLHDGQEISILKSVERISISKESSLMTLPTAFELAQNYPNPFNPTTTIQFSVPEKGNVKITLYNLLGEKVADLFDAVLEPGYHRVQFDAQGLSSGVFLYVMESGHFRQTKKMILMR